MSKKIKIAIIGLGYVGFPLARLFATKINRDLGWKPPVTFEEGLAKTIDWYLDNSQWLKTLLQGNIKIIINYNITNIYERNNFSRGIGYKTLPINNFC